MTTEELKPRVRFFEPVPFEHEGERYVNLRDPFHYTPEGLSVSLPAFMLITYMDGSRTVEDICAAFKEEYGGAAAPEGVRALVRDLDNNRLLDNKNFAIQKQQVCAAFAAEPVRGAALAGGGYPDEPAAVHAVLDRFIPAHGGAGPAPFAIVAPHIDLRAGGPVFGAAFARLKNSTAETFVILGIGHALEGDFFACIDKDFETPLGVSPIDREFLEELEKDFGEPIYQQMYAHKHEHSVEFQTLFLQKVLPGGHRIVPILFSFPEVIEELSHPVYNRLRVDRFTAALKKQIDRLGGKVCVIAGIDMSHVGKRFGHAEGLTDERLGEVEREDRMALAFVAAGDKRGFVEYMKEVNPRNHVCGYPALYTLLGLLGGRTGELIEYGQSVEGEHDAVVGFAAMSFSR